MSNSVELSSTILLPEQSYFIWKISHLSLFTALYALYTGHYDLAICPGGVYLTSILYWRYPDYSWRRYLDMSYVTFAVSYQSIRAYNAKHANLYYATMGASMCFYPIGVYYYNKHKYWHSTYAHSMLHLGANIANMILYR